MTTLRVPGQQLLGRRLRTWQWLLLGVPRCINQALATEGRPFPSSFPIHDVLLASGLDRSSPGRSRRRDEEEKGEKEAREAREAREGKEVIPPCIGRPYYDS